MAEEKFYIIPNVRTVTSEIKEKNSSFLCPSNTVLTGRYHKGDENGKTRYEYATLKAIDSSGDPVAGTITVEDVQWDSAFKESSGNGYDAPTNRVLVGRKHSGDENGGTIYEYASLKAIDYYGNKVDGVITISDLEWSESYKESESSNFFFAPEGRVLTGRQHSGDENGNTKYQTGVVYFNGKAATVIDGSAFLPSISFIESTGKFFSSASKFVVVGRTHSGDENKETTYYQGYIAVQK